VASSPPLSRQSNRLLRTKEIKKFKDSEKERYAPMPPPRAIPPPPSAPPPAPPVPTHPTPRPQWPRRLSLLPPLGLTSYRRLLLRESPGPPSCTARRRAAPRSECGPCPGWGQGHPIRLGGKMHIHIYSCHDQQWSNTNGETKGMSRGPVWLVNS